MQEADESVTVSNTEAESVFTEDNVIYNALHQNTRNPSGRKTASQRNTSNEVTADFDVVLGFDMSEAMYSFDRTAEQAWLVDFEALSEQVPDGTRFSLESNETGDFDEDLNTVIETNNNLTYSGDSDIISMLDKCADSFDEQSEDRVKIVLATAAEISDEDELSDKIAKLKEQQILPFVFVLDSESELNELDNVYECETELDLRLAMSDLYLAFAEYRNAVNVVNALGIDPPTNTAEYVSE